MKQNQRQALVIRAQKVLQADREQAGETPAAASKRACKEALTLTDTQLNKVVYGEDRDKWIK